MTIAMSQLFVLAPSRPASLRHFVEFWAERYYYPNEPLYLNNINNRPQTAEGLAALFKWKIGNKLIRYKMPDLKKHFIDRLDVARKLVKKLVACEPREMARRFLDEFKDSGAIYRIFWLHCWCPRLPIYDQHVHRAMTFITDNGKTEDFAKLSPDKKVQLYLDRYIAFFGEFRGIDGREVDKALWQFGKSMKDDSLPRLRDSAKYRIMSG